MKKKIYEQLQKWYNGESTHDEEQCCPDFSCCTGIIAPIEQRERFIKAVIENDHRTRNEMLGMFLGKAIASEFKESVYIAGTDNGYFQ